MDLQTWVSQKSPRFGSLITIDNPAIIEIARLAGFDWLWIDAEHGQFHENGATVACGLLSSGPPVFVRLPDHAPTTIKRYLETGCDGVILPAVTTLEDVQKIARAALYPPRGERSVGIARAQAYGANFSDYLAKKSYAIVVQIETVKGVENAQAIIAHEAVDGVIIGPYDLSGSFGIPGQIDAPQVGQAIAKVRRLCSEARKPCGIFAAAAAKAREYAAEGFDLVAVGIDTMILLNALTEVRQSLR